MLPFGLRPGSAEPHKFSCTWLPTGSRRAGIAADAQTHGTTRAMFPDKLRCGRGGGPTAAGGRRARKNVKSDELAVKRNWERHL
jgi:hypothetical protein